MIGIGIGVPLYRFSGVSIDAQAQAHYNRVIADGGVIPAGLLGCNSFFVSIKNVYSVTDITTALSVGYDPHYLGFKMGAGSGVTLGQAARKLYSCCGASGDLEQATAASQPLLLEHSGVNYWQAVGLAANFVSTPNATANQITGNIEITAQINPLTLNIDQNIVNKSGVAGSTMGYNFFLNSGGGLSFSFSPTGSVASRTTVASTASLTSVGLSANTIFWVKVTRNATNGSIEFFTSTNGITFSQLGTTINSIVGNLFNSTEQLNIGTWGNVLHFFSGKIYRSSISNSIGGNPVVDFNPASYNAATSQTQWTSATGEVWTINTGTASTGYKGVLVDRTTVQGDGIDDLLSNSLSSTQPYTEYIAHNRLGTGNLIRKATGNSLSHNASVYRLNNGVNLDLSNTSRLLQLITVRNNSSNSGLAINNGAETTGNAGANNGTDIALIQGNIELNTYLQSIFNDTNAQRLAMFNAIKPFNNNAF